jgi:hypothetical protein
MAKKPIDPFAERLIAFFDEIGLPHSEIRFRSKTNNEIFSLHHGMESSKGRFYYVMNGWITQRLLTLWTFPLVQIPAEQLQAVAEYAIRANREEWFGHFDLEYANGGRIGFCTTLLCEGLEPGYAVLRDWLDWKFGTISMHVPYIQSILAGSASPLDALTAQKADLYKVA